ncbi:MAG: AAA family ATPase [Succinatimonas sp.]|nr:AAA family ATPase [Succinatimonas sp.]
MSDKQFLELPYGKDDFTKLREQNCYFVDKTPYLKQVFGIDASDVLLFTRPRRFGKTLLISMFDSFLKINPEKPFDTSKQLGLFKGTKILEDKEFCDKFMGQCPVITITLKKVEGTNFKEFYESFASAVYDVALRYSYLKNSNKLDKSDKEELEHLTTKSYLLKIENQQTVKDALRTLSRLLYKEYGRRAILLIDEYDVPLATASYRDRVNKVLYKNRPDFVADCHEKMVALMKGFFDLLKTTPGDEGAISKAVITGCLKVAKNSLFTGVNNFNVCSVVDREQKYTGTIGFTKDETYKFLKDYEFEDFSEKVKEHYDGYKFFDKEMFCPWDVVNFIKKNFELKQQGLLTKIRADNYWVGTSSDKALYDYLGYLTDTDNQKMQDLVDGKSISFKLNESMNYDTLSEHNSNDFWSLLLHTGYLTVDWEKTDDVELSKDHSSNKNVVARIPNLEILGCFNNNIKERFGNVVKRDNLALNISNALLDGNVDFVQNKLSPLLRSFVSVRDTATRAPHENYYHGFLNGIFTNCKDNLGEYHSNIESCDGYPDILFKDIDCRMVAIIELKSAPTGSDLVTLSETALSQIEEKNYSEPFMTNRMIQSIYAYGIAFAGKNCFITCKKLK